MIGDTSMAATMNTVVFVVSPPAAITHAPIKFNQVLMFILALLLISLYNSSVVLLYKHQHPIKPSHSHIPSHQLHKT